METKLRELHTILKNADLEYDAIELAEVIWLTQYIDFSREEIVEEKCEENEREKEEAGKKEEEKPKPKSETIQQPSVKKIIIQTEIVGEASVHVSTKSTQKSGLPIHIERIPFRLNQTKFYNALKYFRQKRISTTDRVLDIDRIVDVKADTTLFIPYYKATYQNRYDLLIVLDNSDTIELWSEEITKFIDSIKSFNLFKSIQDLYLDSSAKKSKFFKTKRMKDQSFNIKQHLKNDTLVMIISDMTSSAWRSGEIASRLYQWQNRATLFVLQMFPSHLWGRTILKDAELVRFESNRNRKFNPALKSDVDDMLKFLDSDFKEKKVLKLPIATMEPNSLEALSKVVTGRAKSTISGAIIYIDKPFSHDKLEISDSQRVNRFYENSSKISHQLAHYLSVVPLDMNVMKIVRKLMIQGSSKVHLAEILTGGLFKKEDELYQFYHSQKESDGIREILLNQLGTSEYLRTIQRLSHYVEHHIDTGYSALFQAILKDSNTREVGALNRLDTEFARINIKRLMRLGGKYKKLAQRLTVEIEAILPLSKRFQMGSKDGNDDEKPVHTVTFNYDFEIAPYPVTVGEFRAFVEEDGYKTDAEKGDGAYVRDGKEWGKKKDAYWDNPYFEQTEENPVVCVSWDDAQEYIKWLNKKTGDSYRLPTEAEWEYACRAGTTTKWSFGDTEKELEKYAWYGQKGGKGTMPVGGKEKNPWGLYDMHGNVWEWCEDDLTDSYEKTPRDGSAHKDENSGSKVLRGGSWVSSAGDTRSPFRFRFNSVIRYYLSGFRLVLQGTLP